MVTRSDVSVSKNLAPPGSTVLDVDSGDMGYTAKYDGYSSAGDTEEEAIDNLMSKLKEKGYEVED